MLAKISRCWRAATRQHQLIFPPFISTLSAVGRDRWLLRGVRANTKTLSGSMRSEPRRLIRSACMQLSSAGSLSGSLRLFCSCCAASVPTSCQAASCLNHSHSLSASVKEQIVATGTSGDFYFNSSFFCFCPVFPSETVSCAVTVEPDLCKPCCTKTINT